MNILYFTHEKEYGGSSRALITLIKDLRENNNIYVVVPFKNSKIIPELEEMGVKTIHFFYSWWQIPIQISYIKKIAYKLAYMFNNVSKFILANKIKKLDIDIIHSNTSVIDIGAKIANKLNISHVWHFRELQKNNLQFIKSDKASYAYINDFGGNIIYISKAVENYYSKNINDNKSELIYDGVSEDFIIKDKKYKDKYNEIEFLLAGTLHEGKGQHLAIKAIGELKKRGYENIKLYLAGGDPIGYSKYLKTIVNEYKIEKNVEYLGFVKDLKKIREKIDVELICSEAEAFGLVTIEGMLAGNMLIGSNSGATSELIKDGETGYLYECNNIEDLVNQMEKIIKNTSKIETIGKNAQLYAINNFLGKQNAEKVLDCYRKIIEVKK